MCFVLWPRGMKWTTPEETSSQGAASGHRAHAGTALAQHPWEDRRFASADSTTCWAAMQVNMAICLAIYR